MKNTLTIALLLSIMLPGIASAYTTSGARTYSAPARSYTAPSRSYTAPSRTYTAPARTYTPPATTYVAPKNPSPKPSPVAPVSSFTSSQPAQVGYFNPFSANWFLWYWMFSNNGSTKNIYSTTTSTTTKNAK